MISSPRTRDSGFTLIEIIATLLIASIVGAMMFQYMGTSFIRSSEAVTVIKNSLELQKTIEHITDDYDKSARDISALGALQSAINNGDYTSAAQSVLEVVIMDFDASNPNDPQVLKVTVSDTNTGERLTVLFSVRS